MGRRTFSHADLAAADIQDKKINSFGPINHLQYAIRAIKDRTEDGFIILADKKAVLRLNTAKDVVKKIPKLRN